MPRFGVLLAIAAIATSLGGCFGGGDSHDRAAAPARPRPVPVPDLNELRPSPEHPNIVFVLTDDLTTNLLPYMPHVGQLRERGVSFSNYFVTDSLCCPSRASIFTGRLPHNTGIFGNIPPDGGFHAFHRLGEERSTFATALTALGYRTALMGKYLNGYRAGARLGSRQPYVPPGWSGWEVAGNGYPEFHYWLNSDGTIEPHGARPSDYLTDVIARKGSDFIRESVRERRPFMLELSTFAPHAPYTPAPRDARRFPGLRAPRPPSFDVANRRPPTWLARSRPLRRPAVGLIDRQFRRRAQSVVAVDALLARVERTLEAEGVAHNTYVIFSSDNGFHMGEHRLLPGKLTAFESDIRVPLIVAGPGVPGGRTVRKLAANIDLAPTFTRLAGTTMAGPVDGRSLIPLLHARPVARWRDAVLIEHHGPVGAPLDPDLPGVGSGNPTTYEAIRRPHELYVEYADGEAEYYDLRRDPSQMVNTVRTLSPRRRARLEATLHALEHCRGRRSCSAAGRP